MMLAAAGLPRDSAADSSSINEAMPLGTSQFMEQARYNAAIEEELSQSIRRINTIKDARVHLALPRQSAFVRDRADPKASVIVTPFQGRAVSDGQVQAIIHLVSSSVPYLVPANVSVVDQFGRLLTVGIVALLFFQTFINVGMNMSIVPVTGMTLPFISYGGSSLLSMMAAIGLAQSVIMRHRKMDFT
jgi:type III secretory pathway lipoprotein EscJ